LSKIDDMSITDEVSMATARQPQSPDRPDGLTKRSRRTRRDLVTAARALLEEEGIAALTAKAVTDRADVGYGTFYHHFESTEAVLAAGIEESMREFAIELERGFKDADDKAWVFVASLSSTFRMLAAHPAIGWMLERPHVLAAALREACGPFALRDIAAMIEAGDVVAEAAAATTWFEWILVGALVDTAADPKRQVEIEAAVLTLVLRMLGLDGARAAKLIQRNAKR
jgi:AcrR family transcriptional regulator